MWYSSSGLAHEAVAEEEILGKKVVALSTCFKTYFYQFNLFLHLGDENALNMMESLKLPTGFLLYLRPQLTYISFKYMKYIRKE